MSIGDFALTLAVGVTTGALSAFFGIGGGVLIVPYLVLVMERSQHLAEGTSLAVIVVTGLAGVVAHRKAGHFTLGPVLLIAAGGVAGALIGSTVAQRLSGQTLRLVFAAYLAIVGVMILASGLKRKNEPRGDEATPTASG